MIDATTEHFVFQVTGTSYKVGEFLDIMQNLGMVEVARTGVAAMQRGQDVL